ncbi:MAG: hypothetical protein ACKO7W_05010 [Elainella sp.]
MRREIVQDFLNEPGIVGVALMGGTSTPCFCGFEFEAGNRSEFGQPQQLAIAQNIQQVLETIPEGFNSFEFQFDGYRAYLHKLNRGTTLLVLTLNHLARLTYTQAVRRLLIELQIDQADPIPEFRALTLDLLPPQPQPVGQPSTPQPEHNASSSPQPPTISPPSASWPPGSRSPTTAHPSPSLTNGTGRAVRRSPPAHPPAGLADGGQPEPALNPQKAKQDAGIPLIQPSTGSTMNLPGPTDTPPADAAQPQQAPDPPDSDPTPRTPSLWGSDPERAEFGQIELVEPDTQSASLKDVLAAINRLSQFTSQYLGTLVVANYWKATCPAEDWLSHFQIERSAQMTFAVQIPSQPLPILTVRQHQCLKHWVAAFLERCSKVMRNFGKIVRQALTPQELALLFDELA